MNTPWNKNLMPAEKNYARIGINSATGIPARIPLTERVLITGDNGSGKTRLMRTLIATAALRGADVRLLDAHGEEAAAWSGIVPTATAPDDLTAAIEETHAEMRTRLKDITARNIPIWDGPARILAVDEGATLLAAVRDTDTLERFHALAALGRSGGIVLWWATANPTVAGRGRGITSMLDTSIDYRLALRTHDPRSLERGLGLDYSQHVSARDVSQARHGVAFMANSSPSPILVDSVDDTAVKSLLDG